MATTSSLSPQQVESAPWEGASKLISAGAVVRRVDASAASEYRRVELEVAQGRVSEETKRRYSAVLCLTVLDHSVSGTKVLVGVRDPDRNLTHPNVLSTPTLRISWRDLCLVVGNADRREPKGEGVLLRSTPLASGSPDPRTSTTRPQILQRLARQVLTSKLGTPSANPHTGPFFEVETGLIVAGAAEYANLGLAERIVMLGLIMRLRNSASCFPEKTPSYKQLVWTPVSTFVKAVDERDPFLIFDGGDPFEICVHGLCVAASRQLLLLRPELSK